MSKIKTSKKSQGFAAPFSVLLFTDDMAELKKQAAESGVAKSTLIRLAVRDGLKRKIFAKLIAS